MKKMFLFILIMSIFCFNIALASDEKIYSQVNPSVIQEGKAYTNALFIGAFGLKFEPYGTNGFLKVYNDDKEYYTNNYIKNGDIILIPIREVLEHFENEVKWNKDSKTVEVITIKR